MSASRMHSRMRHPTGRCAEHLHRTQTTVVTLNYDTALERLTGKLDRNIVGGRWPDMSSLIERDLVLDDIYRMPMLPLDERTKNPLGKHPTPTFRLLKPHGSINWYSLGGDDPAGRQIFYDGIHGFYPDTADETDERQRATRNRLRESNKRDLVPLIIPPVAEKSAFYRSHAVKTLWTDFAQAIKEATEIYFVGYSLPKTDLSMRLFLTALIGDNSKAIYRVNRDTSEEFKRNYEEVLASCEWRDNFLGHDNAVELMVNELVAEHERKNQIAHQIAVKNGWLLQCPKCHGYAIASDDKCSPAARQKTRDEVLQLFQSNDALISPFSGDSEELLFLTSELDLNRGYDWNCPCKFLHL